MLITYLAFTVRFSLFRQFEPANARISKIFEARRFETASSEFLFFIFEIILPDFPILTEHLLESGENGSEGCTISIGEFVVRIPSRPLLNTSAT